MGDKTSETPSVFKWSIWTTITYYALCSSTLLVINKVAIHNLPAPTTILYMQLGSAAAVIWVFGQLGHIEVDKLEYEKLKKFALVTLGFALTLYCNIKTLQHSNVETFITFRSSTPLVISVLDYLFLGRTLPGVRSILCLMGLLLGSVGYLVTDSNFKVEAYLWLLGWYVAFTFDTVWVKHVCDTVDMTNWGRAFYNNILALVPLAFLLPGEIPTLLATDWSPINVWGPLLLSCIIGLGMSHASFVLRSSVSATAATVVGICCKVGTVVINCLIWDKHATPMGLGMLFICLIAGTFYKQAPRREDAPLPVSEVKGKAAAEANRKNSEQQPLLDMKPSGAQAV